LKESPVNTESKEVYSKKRAKRKNKKEKKANALKEAEIQQQQQFNDFNQQQQQVNVIQIVQVVQPSPVIINYYYPYQQPQMYQEDYCRSYDYNNNCNDYFYQPEYYNPEVAYNGYTNSESNIDNEKEPNFSEYDNPELPIALNVSQDNYYCPPSTNDYYAQGYEEELYQTSNCMTMNTLEQSYNNCNQIRSDEMKQFFLNKTLIQENCQSSLRYNADDFFVQENDASISNNLTRENTEKVNSEHKEKSFDQSSTIETKG